MELNETQRKSIESAKNLIKLLLTLDEMGEPTAKEIKENSWCEYVATESNTYIN